VGFFIRGEVLNPRQSLAGWTAGSVQVTYRKMMEKHVVQAVRV
jgi:hypothetical protein